MTLGCLFNTQNFDYEILKILIGDFDYYAGKPMTMTVLWTYSSRRQVHGVTGSGASAPGVCGKAPELNSPAGRMTKGGPTLKQLTAVCAANQLATYGTKAQLIERLTKGRPCTRHQWKAEHGTRPPRGRQRHSRSSCSPSQAFA